jgi:ribose-phosphate pyrophosphokinase
MGPDEHFMDILRILSADCGHADKRTLIMPYLYASRQDRKETRESLDCAMALQWLVNKKANEIATFDIHNKGVMNAVPDTPFENVYLTDTMLVDLILKEQIFDYENIICIAPDEGAMKRARFFSEVLDDAIMAAFYKYRSQKILNGNGQIREHRFLGDADDLAGKIAIVTDDMIDTGGSILDTAKQLKELGVSKVYLMATFAFFSKGIEKFQEYYEKGYFEKVYSTNLVYVDPEIKEQPWFESVDCSLNVAQIINALNKGRSIGKMIQGRDDVLRKVRGIRERQFNNGNRGNE